MTISANTVWEVRTTGNDTQCGGGFDATIAGAGTDYSQQNSAQATGTVTSSTTTVTATAGIFTAAMVGNIITDGTTYKQITGYTSATVVTVESAPAWTSATVFVGGALASPGKAGGVKVAGNHIWIKAGTYTISVSTANVSGGIINDTTGGASTSNASWWAGYGTVRGDLAARPLLQVAATGVITITLFALSSSSCYVENISVDGQSKSNIRGFNAIGPNLAFIRCRAINCTNNAFNLPTGYALLCEASACSATFAYFSAGNTGRFLYCSADNCTSGGFLNTGITIGCIASNNTGPGITSTGNPTAIIGCTAYNNTQDGISVSGQSFIINCLSCNNGGYGFSNVGPDADAALILNCAGYNNTSGNNQFLRTEGFVTLTVDPFVGKSVGNYALNNTANGGALCRAAGLSGAFPGLSSTTGYQDIGAVQHRDPLKIRGRLGDGR